MNSGSILDHSAILIDSGMIKLLGDYSTLKSSVDTKNQIDVNAKFIIPGLWDMHIHIEGQDLVEDNLALFPVFIAYGITTVRDMASDLGEQVLSWRGEIDKKKLVVHLKASVTGAAPSLDFRFKKFDLLSALLYCCTVTELKNYHSEACARSFELCCQYPENEATRVRALTTVNGFRKQPEDVRRKLMEPSFDKKCEKEI